MLLSSTKKVDISFSIFLLSFTNIGKKYQNFGRRDYVLYNNRISLYIIQMISTSSHFNLYLFNSLYLDTEVLLWLTLICIKSFIL